MQVAAVVFRGQSCKRRSDSGGAGRWENGAGDGMHANVHADRNEWRLPPDETLQVADPKAKKAEVGGEEVSTRRPT